MTVAHLNRQRLLLVLWAAIFIWWCLAGASLVYGRMDYDEPAVWVRTLSWPWVVAAAAVVAMALRRPSHWAWTLIGVITVVHTGLVVWTW